MSKSSLVMVLAATFSFSACSSIAQDTITNDMECFVSMRVPESFSDERTRSAAAAVATFYLGRLDQRGLTLEQIQSGVEKIVLSPVTNLETSKKDFFSQCIQTVNDRVGGLKALAARDKARMGIKPR